mmetsp:Transcript_16968/g.37062  ORF Transcript_16968/g.37062 Transcript_16968/m.37062 type:complete len:413 (+) Transcript_16968:105-1343(+)|eukprot:CAMPEP_0168776322 /NCGR_PEP_ID=MMETSP0725-20121227/5976_1 /TAXON_ID=265536 /ORGANISM="Amphiprora sp., Strain CCMP467" /LENGTH=412 /DNA_ID=CAMNT_0008825995 /DNA_START=105 /DNA_END=1343 /DNA_ORIENTATION=-
MGLPYEWWEYALIPPIAGAVGYITNVLALQMTFAPLEFFGIEIFRIKGEPWGLFGWQGIIPTKAEKMATVAFELMTAKLFNIKEIFGKLDPKKFSDVMSDSVLLMMDEIISDVASEYMPTVWNSLPQAVKDDIVLTTDNETGSFLAEFMQDMQAHVDDVVDIKHFTIKYCVENKHLIVKIFKECGDKEFIFIRRSGFYFGFLFGLIQMGIWFVYDASWVLPVAGFLVGWFTNFIALKVIFRPLEPKKICFYEFHGIFLKRQKEVSAIFARVVMTEILHIKAIWDAIFTGPLSVNFYAMLRAHTLVFTDKLVAEIKPLAVAAMGAEQFARMKEDIAQKVIDRLPGIIDNSYEYTNEVLDMENTVATKMQELSASEFEGVLHPAFEEDEIQLIILGGILGAIVGVIQVFTLFSI